MKGPRLRAANSLQRADLKDNMRYQHDHVNPRHEQLQLGASSLICSAHPMPDHNDQPGSHIPGG